MASARKVRNANKRYAKINEDWQDKDTPSVPKSKVRVSTCENQHFSSHIHIFLPFLFLQRM
jgi:hypothetical protein